MNSSVAQLPKRPLHRAHRAHDTPRLALGGPSFVDACKGGGYISTLLTCQRRLWQDSRPVWWQT